MIGDMLIVAVFDADVFDDGSRDMVESNDEGSIVSAGKNREWFDGEVIERLLSSEPFAPSGAARLSLASQHRDAVLELL
ncbi:hypothetical protein [Actinomadura sp. 6N118]|uniref:hypothetical protein n=1 Tax=Actinomadura sp. 6N118 TaxID=3375151 RepID=UPI0037A6C671